jgi:hypothetical protein
VSALATILSAAAPVVSEAIGLAVDIARAGADPQATIAQLRAILPPLLAAAQSGATPDTEAAWAEHLKRHFGGGGA